MSTQRNHVIAKTTRWSEKKS